MNTFDAKALHEMIKDMGYQPNPWEKKFLKSVQENITWGMKLSDKQGQCLEEIYRKAAEIK